MFATFRLFRGGKLMKTSRIPWALAVVPALFIATATSQTWDGGGTDDDFTTANNWNPNGAPINDGTADLIFSGSTRLTPVVDVDYKINGLTFNAGASAFNIGASGGSQLIVGAGGITNSSPVTQTFSVPVDFASGSSVIANSPLNFTGNVAIGSGQFSVFGASTVSFDNVSGSGEIVKGGTGTLNIASTNSSHNFDVTVNSGIVDLNATMTFSSLSTIAVNGGEFRFSNTVLDGATLTRSSTGILTSGFTAQNNATVDITGSFDNATSFYRIRSGSMFSSDGLVLNGFMDIDSGGSVTVDGDFSMADSGASTPRTLSISGAGSTFAWNRQGSSAVNVADDGDATITVDDGGQLLLTNGAFNLGSANGSAEVTVSGGGYLEVGGLTIRNFSSGEASVVTVTGPGSKIDASFNILSGGVGSGSVTPNDAVLNLLDGGEFETAGSYNVRTGGVLNIDGGILTIANGRSLNVVGSLNFVRGVMNLGQDIGLASGDGNPFGSILELTAGQTVTLPGSRTLSVSPGGIFVLDGGEFRTGLLVNNGGTIDLRRGTFAVTNNTPLTVGTGGPLGKNLSVGTGLNLEIRNTDVVADASVLVDGGSLAITNLTNSGRMELRNGTLDLGAGTNASGGQIIISGAATADALTNELGGLIELKNNGQLGGTSGELVNQGLLTGSGTISKNLTNASTGQIRVSSGQALYFQGTVAPNEGEIQLQGGTVQVSGSLTNSSTGFITGRGALYTAGLTNDGQMAFSGGTTDIHGDVDLTAGSRVATGGAGSTTTFFDDVVHNGAEIYTGAGASTVFFGAQTGSGSFTGPGTVTYTGDLQPGNSPAIITYGGDVYLSGPSTLTMELGGLIAGLEYDQISVAGDLFAAGTIVFELLPGFIPEAGNSFQVLVFGSFSGGFSSIQAPTLPGDLQWDFTSLESTGIISVVPEPATVTLLGLAGGALALVTRRRLRREA